jgi:uridine phosphorylase
LENEGVLIEPRRIPGDPRINGPVILVLYEPYLEILRKAMKVRKADLQRIRFPSLTVFSSPIGSKKIWVVGTPLGAPHAVIALERLIAMGAREVLGFGCCGSLQTNLAIGHLVLPEEAWSEEGTSAHYPLPEGTEARGDERILHLCAEKMGKKKCKYSGGRIWSTDGLFRETLDKIKAYSQMGLLAVEMEMSALFTVAAYRRISFGGVLVVSDELALGKWKSGFLHPIFWLSAQRAARMVLEVVRDL